MGISVNVDIRGALKQLADVKDKQLPFATSLAINRTAQKVKAREEHEIRDVFDRPTPYIQNSVFIKPSNKANLTAKVGIKDQSFGKGVSAIKPLQAEISGGERKLKRYEEALRAIGVLPEGYFTVPGDAAKIDSYGNIAKSHIVQILAYFRANRDVGSTSNSTDKTRAKLAKSTNTRRGISYFVGAPGDGKAPLGIWMRVYSNFGTAIRPILIFVQSANYEAIFDFELVARTTIDKEIDKEFAKAWNEAQRTAK